MTIKNFDDDATYVCTFKDDDSERTMWSDIHCLVAPVLSSRSDGPEASAEDSVMILRNKMAAAYHAMDLYDTVRNGDGRAYGRFLTYVRSRVPSILRYLDIKAADRD